MKKLMVSIFAVLLSTSVFASEMGPSTCYNCPSSVPTTRYMAPVRVHTGRTVTVQDHYDVYRPKVVYEKVNSYSTVKTCTYCD